MAMENSDLVMPTCRNLGRLDTAEAGTDVPSKGLKGQVAEGYVVAHMSAQLSRQKVAGVLAKGLPVSEEQMLSSLVLRVVTEAQGMLEGTANGDGELEGTEHEFSALEICFESVSFY